MTALDRLMQAADLLLQAVVASDVPLDPGNGGRSIGADALQIGDIIVSTTSKLGSRIIRLGTGADVSHAILYVGDGRVVEAIEDGVVERSLAEALADASLAVALRHPRLTAEQALRVRDTAGKAVGLKFDGLGLVQRGLYQLDRITFCDTMPAGSAGRANCYRWVGKVNLSYNNEQRFFCSELVLTAYQSAGLPLTATPPNWTSPGDLQELRLSLLLGYVGHLKTSP